MTFASTPASGKLSKRPDSIFEIKYRRSLIVSFAVFVSYVGYYFLRSHFSVSITAIEADGVLTKQEYGMVIGIAYASNVVGKTAGGILVDMFNRPKCVFLVALALCGVITVVNTFYTSVSAFIVLWCLARLVTSFGWGSVVKIVAAWWPSEHMGTMMGLAAVSCCVGEAVTKITLGALLSILTWKEVYYAATLIAGVLALPTLFLVKDYPKTPSEIAALSSSYADGDLERSEAGQQLLLSSKSEASRLSPAKLAADKNCNLSITDPEFFKPLVKPQVAEPLSPVASPRLDSLEKLHGDTPVLSIPSVSSTLQKHVYVSLGKHEEDESKASYFMHSVILPLVKSPRFLLILFMVLCTTIVRETINNWFTVYLRDLGVAPDKAGMLSSIPSAFGGVSTLLGGWLVDRIPRQKRGLLAMIYLLAMTLFQVVLILFTKYSSPSWGVPARASVATTLITATTFSMWAPYSFFDGVFIVDLIGPKGVAFGSGVVGAIGYFGAFFTMMTFGRMVQTWEGWVNVWIITGSGSLVTVVACFFYWVFDRKSH